MADFWFRLLLGHLVGDYLLQNNWMALQKNKQEGLGTLVCFMHCTSYVMGVLPLTQIWTWQWIVIVFASHYFVDRYGWAEKWLQLIRGRSLTEYLGYWDIRCTPEHPGGNPIDKRHEILRGAFSVLVYTVVDNTMHLVLMYLGWRFLYA
jgi:hypothetical protein